MLHLMHQLLLHGGRRMDSVKGHAYLYIRSGIYYFRKKVSDEYTQFFGKSEIVQSLRTSNLRDAITKVSKKIVAYHDRLNSYDKQLKESLIGRPLPARTEVSKEELEKIVRTWYFEHLEQENIRKTAKFTSKTEVRKIKEFRMEQLEPAVENIEPISFYTNWAIDHLQQKYNINLDNSLEARVDFEDYVLRAQSAITKRHLDQLEGNLDTRYDTDFLSRIKYEQEQAESVDDSALTIKELIKVYQDDDGHSWTANTRVDYEHQHKVIEEFLGSETKVTEITRENCREFQKLIQKYPKNATKKFPGTDFKKAIKKAAKEGSDLLSITSQNKYLGTLSSIFIWAINEGKLAFNPAKGLFISDPEQGKEKIRSFSTEQLNIMFNSILYTGSKDDRRGCNKPGPSVTKRSRYWLPLLSLYTGARLNELAQMNCDEVREVDGFLVFDINQEQDDMSLKNRNSKRIIPVHSELIKLGFKNYIESMQASSSVKLFPDLSNKRNGRYSHQASRHFSNWTIAIGSKRDKTDNRSFRHGYEDALRRARIYPNVHDALCGWKSGKMRDRYGTEFPIDVLSEAIEKITFPGLDLSHLYEN